MISPIPINGISGIPIKTAGTILSSSGAPVQIISSS